ncbi:MAG: two-component system, OmpR family, sensor kinase [Solirubrobacteraceae bacterium]|nr:two-component system, OmpR family, sensor kinase [Solirubrobacteraceae bacterium]
MRPATLRFRLIGAAALATLAAVALLGIAVELLLSGQLHSSLDRSLRERAGQVARLSVSAPALLTTPGTLDAPLGGRELSVQVVDRQGRIVARSSSLGGRVLPGGTLEGRAIARGRAGYIDAHLGSEPIRMYAAPIADAGGPAAGGAVLVASSTAEIDDTLHRLRSLIALSAGGAALLGALAAALLTSRGLRPLQRLSAAARGIEATGDAGRRLPDSDTDDEVGELARTLNRMLAALERARETERRFLADASHELRTPLTALRGNAAYIARHGADREAMADLEADAARLGRLLDDLLALERASGGEAPHDVVELEQVVDEAARRAAEVDVVAREPVAVSGERDAIERALENLLENARVHGPEGGRVTVELHASGGRARLSVADEGPGIPPAEAELAVRRFWRGPGTGGRPGSGLGLAIVAAIAERHGGRLEIEGARFTLDLPALKRFSESGATVP